MAIVHVRTGKPVPEDIMAKVPDSPQKKLMAESHGICFQCAKAAFPNLDHKILFESIMPDQAGP